MIYKLGDIGWLYEMNYNYIIGLNISWYETKFYTTNNLNYLTYFDPSVSENELTMLTDIFRETVLPVEIFRELK